MSSDGVQRRIVPAPIVVVACLACGFIARHFDPRRIFPSSDMLQLAGGSLLIIVALATGVAALRQFHRHGTPASPYAPTQRIVTSGVFRLTRNPMYLGFVLIALGIAIALDSLWLLAAAAALFVLLQELVIKREERFLTRTFGEEYGSYLRRTRRWL